jgi:hypothetical protein
LDFAAAAGRTHTTHADMQIEDITRNGWHGRGYWKPTCMPTICLWRRISLKSWVVKARLGPTLQCCNRPSVGIFNAGTAFEMDGSQFDRLFAYGDVFEIGNLDVVVMHTSGHTPACLTYLIGGAAFISDTLFTPNFGTARAEFTGGSATELYTSIQRILSLPDETALFLCQEYRTKTRDTFCWRTTVAAQKIVNDHVGGGKSEVEFVDFRTTCDVHLAMPKLIISSIQVNMNTEKIPAPDTDGHVYLTVPINKL